MIKISSAFAAMITELESYAGGYRWLHFQDLAAAYGVYEGATYTKIKVISVNKSLRPGGRAIFDPVELIWEDAE